MKRIFTYQLKEDWVIWLLFLFFCFVSITEVFSASSTLTYKSGNHLAPMKDHLSFLFIGFILLSITRMVPYKFFKLFSIVLLPLSAVLLAYLTLGGGETINGASRWFKPFGIQFQPSELAKLAVITTVAWILSHNRSAKGASPKAFKHTLLLVGLFCILIFRENLSTAVLLFVIVYFMMFIGGVSKIKLLKLTGWLALSGLLVVGVILMAPKKTNVPVLKRLSTWNVRITSFFNQEEVPPAKFDIDGKAQEAHANIAIATSSFMGKFFGNSVERDFLPQAFSDFIFAIIIEETGLFGGILIIIAYIILLFRVGIIANRCDSDFARYLILGIVLLIVWQAMINIGVAVGALPITGQPLPFISKGGTASIINCIYIGIILSVSRYVNTSAEKKVKESEPALTETVVETTFETPFNV